MGRSRGTTLVLGPNSDLVWRQERAHLPKEIIVLVHAVFEFGLLLFIAFSIVMLLSFVLSRIVWSFCLVYWIHLAILLQFFLNSYRFNKPWQKSLFGRIVCSNDMEKPPGYDADEEEKWRRSSWANRKHARVGSRAPWDDDQERSE